MRSPLLVAVLAVAVAGGATTGALGWACAARAATLPTASPPSPIAWTACPKELGYRCGTVQVPVDYQRPAGPFLWVAVIEKPATAPVGPVGTLLFNPGGPGESGVQILPVLAALVPPAISSQFNLVSFDERGTGASGRLACGPSPAAVAGVLAVPARAGAPLPAASLYRTMAAACRRSAPSLFPNVDTTDAARDMDRVRQALGASHIDYWGLSYGTVLGSTYARLFPGRVRAMVLDGAVDAAQSLMTQASEEAPAIVASLDHFFATCAAETGCALGSDPRAYYEHLEAQLKGHPLPAPGDGDEVPVTVGDLYAATLFYLSVPALGGAFPGALVAAAGGNGAPLRSLSLNFEEDLDGTSLVGPQWAYTCNDAAKRPSPVAAGTLARSLAARYGGIGGYAVTYDVGACVDWPAGAHPVTGVRVTGGPPILVIGTTGDPNTPYTAAQSLARDLGSGHLVTWQGWGHTWLLNGSSDSCMQAIVDAYLRTLTVPAAGATCA